MTTTLPTDRNGNVYYGCSTYKEAEKVIEDLREDARDYDDDSFDLKATARKVASAMESAGYQRAAARVRKAYNV